jgi:hypothetical protein
MRLEIHFCTAIISAMSLVGVTTTIGQAGPATEPATTQPVMSGRDSPAGAMKVFEQAVENGDLVTVADSYNLPEAAKIAFAEELVAVRQFSRALEARFGHEAAVNVCSECYIRVQPSQKYAPEDWHYPTGQPDIAIGDIPGVEMMEKGPDGIWRIGRIFLLLRPRPAAADRRVTQAADLAAKLKQITPGIKSGKYATPDDVINAVYPQGSPMAQMRAQQEQEKKEAQAQEQQFLAEKFDLSTLGGAASAYVQAIQKNDAVALAHCFFAKDDPDGKLALARAEQIISTIQLSQAIGNQVDKIYGESLLRDFGLISEPLSLMEFTQMQQHDDRAVVTYGPGEGKKSVWFQLIGGEWKQDITPDPPATAAERAEDMKEDAIAIKRIAADTQKGKYKTLPEVRDALGAAMLNQPPDPMFAQNDMLVEGEPQPGFHPAPALHGPPVLNRTSPAGAMNTFVEGLQKLDAAELADSLYMPEDKDGSGRKASAQDYIVGMRFLRALETRFATEDVDRICFWCGVIQSYSLTQYSDEQWATPTDYPDLALSSGTAIQTKTIIANNTPTINNVMGWIPVMHHCNDGLWRIGPRFPQNSRQIHATIAALAAKDAILEKMTDDVAAGKYATAEDVMQAIPPSILHKDSN